MRKLIVIFSVLVSSLAFGQEDVPYQMFGVWQNTEGEFLKISRAEDKVIFQRRNSNSILAVGTIEVVDGELHVIRTDTPDSYNLIFYIGTETVAISRPRSKQAWLWTRIK